jgi:hypothetical protein
MASLQYIVFPRDGVLWNAIAIISTSCSEISSASLTRVAVPQVARRTPEQRKVNHSFAASLSPGVTPSKYIFFGTDESSVVLLVVETVACEI